MSSEAPEQNWITRFVGAAQQTSLIVLFSLLFAVPGVVALHFLAPHAIGFYLIAMTATIAHIQLKALNSDIEVDSDDLPELEGRRAALFLLILLVVAAAGITMKLLASTALALLTVSIGNDAILAILLAIVFPVFDREIADERWYLSVAGLSGIGTLLAIAWILTAIGIVNNIYSDSLRSVSDRLIV